MKTKISEQLSFTKRNNAIVREIKRNLILQDCNFLRKVIDLINRQDSVNSIATIFKDCFELYYPHGHHKYRYGDLQQFRIVEYNQTVELIRRYNEDFDCKLMFSKNSSLINIGMPFNVNSKEYTDSEFISKLKESCKDLEKMVDKVEQEYKSSITDILLELLGKVIIRSPYQRLFEKMDFSVSQTAKRGGGSYFVYGLRLGSVSLNDLGDTAFKHFLKDLQSTRPEAFERCGEIEVTWQLRDKTKLIDENDLY